MDKTRTYAAVRADIHAHLADEINEHIAAAQEHAEAAVLHAVKAGRALLQAKVTIPHGEWLGWLAKNVPSVTARACQGYMQVAARYDKMPEPDAQRVALLPLRTVLRMIANTPPKPMEAEPAFEEDPVNWAERKAKREKSRASWKKLRKAQARWARNYREVVFEYRRFTKGDTSTIAPDVELLAHIYELLAAIREQAQTLKHVIRDKRIDAFDLASLHSDMHRAHAKLALIEAWAAKHVPAEPEEHHPKHTHAAAWAEARAVTRMSMLRWREQHGKPKSS